MSKPAIIPDTTASGIAVDPRTLERVIPESRRPDGSVRKQIKIRPGFTPQEDVRRFRGTRQAQMDANQLPKGHIIGWAPPPKPVTGPPPGSGLSKSAKKSQKKREKREQAEWAKVKASWEDDDEDEARAKAKASWEDEDEDEVQAKEEAKEEAQAAPVPAKEAREEAKDGAPAKQKEKQKEEDADVSASEGVDALADDIGKLEVR